MDKLWMAEEVQSFVRSDEAANPAGRALASCHYHNRRSLLNIVSLVLEICLFCKGYGYRGYPYSISRGSTTSVDLYLQDLLPHCSMNITQYEYNTDLHLLHKHFLRHSLSILCAPRHLLSCLA